MTLATSRCISRQHNVTALLYPVYKTASQTTITCHSLSLKCLLSLFHRDQIYVTACCLLGQTECFFLKYLLFNWNKSHTTNKSLNKHVPFHWILSHISILEAIFQRFYYSLYSYLTTYENILWNILLFSIFTEHFQPAFTLSFFFLRQLPH